MRLKPSFLFVGEFRLLESNADRHRLGLRDCNTLNTWSRSDHGEEKSEMKQFGTKIHLRLLDGLTGLVIRQTRVR